jgi:hypothetical protein
MSLPKRPPAGFVLSLISGIFILLNAILVSLVQIFASFYFTGSQSYWLFTMPWLLLFLAGFGAVCALLVLVGAYLLYKGRNISGGLLVVLFSVLSLPIGGGFVVGFILGIVGGALALVGL